MKQTRRKKWWFWLGLFPIGLAYTYLLWQHAAVVLVRHSSTPGGWLGLDLQSCIHSERIEIRLAAGQRMADFTGSRTELLPIIRSIWQSEDRINELGWFAAYALARMDDEASDVMALVALDGLEPALRRFEQLAGDQQAEALLRFLAQQELGSRVGSQRASAAVLRLGSLGENANFELPMNAESDRLMRVRASIEKPIEKALAARIATEILYRYRDFELPPAVELALVQLGEPAVAPICHQLAQGFRSDVHFRLRIGLYRVLRRMGPLARAAESTLVRAIEFEPVNQSFMAALAAVTAMEPEDRRAVASAIRAAKVSQRWESAGYSVASIESACMAALADLGDDQAIDEMIAELSGTILNTAGVRIPSIDAAESWRTMRKLGGCGPRAARALDVVSLGLESRAAEIRIEAALAYFRLGGDAAKSRATLIPFLEPRQNAPSDIGLALIGIAEIRWPIERGPEPLLRLLQTGPTSEIRQLAADVLQRSYPNDNDVTDAFADRLVVDRDGAVRQTILSYLETRLNDDDSRGIPKVDVNQAVRWLRENWSPGLAETMTGERELQVWLAQRTLRAAGNSGAEAVAQWLVDAGDCPAQAINLFDDLGPARSAAIPKFVRAIQRAEPGVARLAVTRLGEMRDLAAPAFREIARTQFPETEAALRKIDPSAYVASTARWAEWYALWGTPVVLMVLLVIDWGWTKSGQSAIMSSADGVARCSES